MFFDQEKLAQVVAAAFDAAHDSTRWQTAIVKAWRQLEENPYIHEADDALLILSPSGEIYSANGTCGCKAFEKGFPCWHRAAARIVERYRAA
jgi:hypothetical protein